MPLAALGRNPAGMPVEPADVVRLRNFGPTEALALVVALGLTAAGIAGFLVTGLDHFADHDTGQHLVGFELNGLHNAVHLVLGVVGLVAWTRLRWSIAYGALLAVGYAAVVVYGMFALHEEWDVLSLNRRDNWLHVALATVGLVIVAVGSWEQRRRTTARSRRDDVIDLTVEDRLRDVVPETMSEPVVGHRSTGLPTARRR
jgi:hypothetical protein